MKSMYILYFSLITIFLLCINSCSSDDNYTDPSPINQAVYEEGEEFLTGSLSINSQSHNAFGRAIPTLTTEQSVFFGVGNSLFNQSWVSAPASTTARDGLGPTFNARACASCHARDGRGRPITPGSAASLGFLMRISLPGTDNHGGPNTVPNYGGQIQEFANHNIPFEAKVTVTYDLIEGTYPDGTPFQLQKPIYQINQEQFGSLQNVLTSPRVGPQTIGLGFVDTLTEAAILANADEFDQDNDGISGRANYVWDAASQATQIGRFGWKANQPNLKQQVAGAFHGDMGLTTSLFNDNNCPGDQVDCQNAFNGGTPEITDQQLDRVTFYQQTLGVPIRRNFRNENVLKGKVLFNQLQCISCHATNFTAENAPNIPGIEGVEFDPYSDFLLHDMGEELADNRPDFIANGKEWRTQPLWGIGLIATVNNHTFFLHDGRARSIEEAILWHGGEAENSKNNFMNLSKTERDQLIAFINSL